jgi:pyridoxal phosphate enzyme (YggS family)
MTAISQALNNIRARMTAAADKAGREPASVRLIAVSKTFQYDAVLDAVAAGQIDFGENRVEEALPKIDQVAAQANGLRWHLIGHVQTRKAKDAGRRFALIHSVDSVRLAAKINAFSPEAQDILLECNISGEDSKEGFALSGWQDDAAVLARFVDEAAQIVTLPNLRVRGLMTMAPIVEDPELARPFFASLRRLRGALRERFPDSAHVSWNELSMGMTNDFEAAIAEGATLVRIGRAIFGAR